MNGSDTARQRVMLEFRIIAEQGGGEAVARRELCQRLVAALERVDSLEADLKTKQWANRKVIEELRGRVDALTGLLARIAKFYDETADAGSWDMEVQLGARLLEIQKEVVAAVGVPPEQEKHDCM